MDRNKIFALLLSLTDFNKDVASFIALLESKGYKPISANQIRSWRRVGGNPVPNFVLETLFDLLFEKKKQDRAYFSAVPLERLKEVFAERKWNMN